MQHNIPESQAVSGTALPNANAPERVEISILDLIAVLARRKRLIVVTTLLITGTTAAGVLFMHDSFKAQAVILPPQQQQSSLAVLAAGAMGSAASQLGIKTPGDVYVGMLKSRSIADEIVAKFHLEALYKKRFLSDSEKALSEHASFVSGKDSLITITFEDEDPKRAAAIANAFIDGLYNLTSRLAVTSESQRRVFFEQELRKEKDNLSDAEVALTNLQRSTGLLLPAGQESVLIGSTARLRAEISSHEVALQSTQTFATEDNPQVQVLRRELAAMRGQLNDLETKGGAASNFEMSAGKLPDATLGYVRKVRDLKYHEALFELLARQYEAARLDESKQAPLIQVIDRANVPDRKSGPHRGRSILAVGLLGFVLSSLYVLGAHSIKALATQPERAESIAALRSAVRFRT